jgi:phospholipid transport system substrate-binding protein
MCSSTPFAFSGEPMEIVEFSVYRVVEILQNQDLNMPDIQSVHYDRTELGNTTHVDDQGKRIQLVIEKFFDFSEVSRYSLGRHWKHFSPSQQKTFAELFSRIIGHLYIKQIQENYHAEKIAFTSEKIEGLKATVDMRITSQQSSMMVSFRMMKKNERWIAYDIVIDGVSLLRNYRNQFNRLLSYKSPAQVIEQLSAHKYAQVR